MIYNLKKIDKERTGLLCLTCGDLLISWSVHDFKWCSCSSCHVDGGTSYLKFGYLDKTKIQLITINSADPIVKEPKIVLITDENKELASLKKGLKSLDVTTVTSKSSRAKNFLLDLDADRQYQKTNYKFIAYGTKATKLLKELNIPFLHLKSKKIDKQTQECYNYIYD